MCEVLNDNVGTLNPRVSLSRLPIPPRPSRGVGLGVADGCVGSRPSMFTVVGFTGCSPGGWAGCVWSVPLEGPGGWCAEE